MCGEEAVARCRGECGMLAAALTLAARSGWVAVPSDMLRMHGVPAGWRLALHDGRHSFTLLEFYFEAAATARAADGRRWYACDWVLRSERLAAGARVWVLNLPGLPSGAVWSMPRGLVQGESAVLHCVASEAPAAGFVAGPVLLEVAEWRPPLVVDLPGADPSGTPSRVGEATMEGAEDFLRGDSGAEGGVVGDVDDGAEDGALAALQARRAGDEWWLGASDGAEYVDAVVSALRCGRRLQVRLSTPAATYALSRSHGGCSFVVQRVGGEGTGIHRMRVFWGLWCGGRLFCVRMGFAWRW